MTDYVVRGISIAGIAMPSFWLGILIILGLLIGTQAWFGTPGCPGRFQIDFRRSGLQPLAIDLAGAGHRLPLFGWRHGMTRSAMLEVLREDYVRTSPARKV